MGANEQPGLIQIPEPLELPTELRALLGEPQQQAMTLTAELPDVDLDRLPKVVGYRVLVLPVRPPKATDSGIALVADAVRHMELMRSVGVVLAAGSLAFSEERRWPKGYREDLGLAQGVWVQFHAQAGQEVRVRSRDGREVVVLKYLNDSDILGVLGDDDAAKPYLVLI